MADGRDPSASTPDAGPMDPSRRRALKQLGAAGLAAGLGPALLAGCHGDPHPDAKNVLVFVADDMRLDHLPFMPNVQQLIAAQGRTFTQARCNVPLCQPSRVGFFTGQMSKHNGELAIGYGGSVLSDHDNTLAGWAHAAGYHCGMFGKYVNGIDSYGGIPRPAPWRTWRELVRDTGYEFTVHDGTAQRTFTGTYSTDYLGTEALTFLSRVRWPFLCVVAPTQPHAPFTPRTDHADDWLDAVPVLVEEHDVSDKPPWIRDLPPLTDDDRERIRQDFVGRLQELTAVDEVVGRVLTGMDPAVLADTVVVFTSDNGVHQGEHRKRGAATKSGPYEVALRVPMVARGPGFEPGADVHVPVMAFQDLAATIVEVGHAAPGLPHQAGTSLRTLCAAPAAHAGRTLLHEVGEGWNLTGDGVTTGPDHPSGFRKLYRYPSVRVTTDGPFTYEAYDLDTDPHEDRNWADDPGRRAERDALEAELLALRLA